MSRLAPSLCLCQLVQPPFDQEVDIILSWLTDLCLLDLMRKHISVLKNRKYSIYLLPWTHFSVLAGVKPRVHGGQIFCKLSLNIHIPISDPLIDPTTSSCRDLGTSEVVGSRPRPEDRFHTWTFKTSSWLSGGSCHVTMVEVEWWLLRPKSGLWGRPDGFPGDIVSVESSLSTPIVAKDGRVLVKLIGDQQILLENLQIKVQLTAVVLLHGH